MFQTQNRETINSARKVAVSCKIIMTTSMTRPCFTTHTRAARPRPRFFLVSDQSCPKNNGLRPHHCTVHTPF